MNSERALAIYEELEDLPGQANTLNMLGMAAYWRGDWDAALDYYRRAWPSTVGAGNPVNVAFQRYNIGEIALDQGHFGEAEEQFTDAAREWRGAGYRSGVAAASAMLARVAAARGRFDDALQLCGRAIDEFRAIGSHAEELEGQARLAEIQLLSGDPAAALDTADAALAGRGPWAVCRPSFLSCTGSGGCHCSAADTAPKAPPRWSRACRRPVPATPSTRWR